ncbi:MAG: uracil-DNA glycosylase [Acidobacteriota bacterium]|nr:uracil-DNA glycosylase [Acidobacteriota bacterium]
MSGLSQQQLRAYVDYLRDMGIYDLYRQNAPRVLLPEGFVAGLAGQRAVARPAAVEKPSAAVLSPFAAAQARRGRPPIAASAATAVELEPSMAKPISFDELVPLPAVRVSAAERAAALEAIRVDMGDCTRCPLAYAGRHTIVFGDGDANAKLMFVGEGPGADEDASGVPFVGKAGQLLNNMIAAMGVAREQVYIANIVKCRPPQNRVPEPVEANTCSQFLVRQIDVVRPQVIVALGATAATYLLGVRQSLASLRGRWHSCRGAKVAVTYHPAFLLRDPRQKGEAWKDLQMVMAEMGLQPPKKG